jgi:hypothetical protein
MKFAKGDIVEDSWYLEAGDGKIVAVLKTRVKVFFERALFYHCTLFCRHKSGIVTYDKAHFKLLKKHHANK